MKLMKKSPAAELVDALAKEELDVTLLSSPNSPCNVTEWLSTGCVALDRILGGGLPVGRITEIHGDTSTGKSLIAAQVAALAQDDGHIVMMADSESALSLPIVDAVGVDIDNLIYSVPDTVEEVFEQFEKAIEFKAKKHPDELMVLIWDSVAATSVKQEMEKDYGAAFMGRHAGVISQSMRKITRQVSKNRICLLILNQTRENIGVMFGDNETTFGGKAIPFHSSIRVRLKLGSKITIGSGKKKKVIGLETNALVIKNKVAEPFHKARLPIFFGHGIDDDLASLYWLQDNDYIDAASWMRMELGGEEVKFQRRGKHGWRKVYDKYYDEIWDIIMEGISNEWYNEEVADEGYTEE
jgi:recombination protein RecA